MDDLEEWKALARQEARKCRLSQQGWDPSDEGCPPNLAREVGKEYWAEVRRIAGLRKAMEEFDGPED